MCFNLFLFASWMSAAAADVGVIARSPAVIAAVLTELRILGNHALTDRMGTFHCVGHSSHLDINLTIRRGNYNIPDHVRARCSVPVDLPFEGRLVRQIGRCRSPRWLLNATSRITLLRREETVPF